MQTKTAQFGSHKLWPTNFIQIKYNMIVGDNILATLKTIRKACLEYKVSYITTIAGALAAVKGIESVKNGMGGEGGVRSLQEYHSLIK